MDSIFQTKAEGLAIKQELLAKLNSPVKDVLMIADTPITTQPISYWAGESGTYTNAGGLVVDTTGKLVVLNYDGTTWSKLETAAVEGKDAYDIAVANGFVGTEAEWLASLEGKVKASDFEVILDSLIDGLVYKHVNGDSEYAPDSAYGQIGVAFQQTIEKNCFFNTITVSMSKYTLSDVEARIYKIPPSTTFDPSTATLLDTVLISETVNLIHGGMQKIVLNKTLYLDQDDVLVVAVRALDNSNLRMGRWTTAGSPPREALIYSSTGSYIDFNTGWTYGSLPAYSGVPMILEYEADLSQAINRTLANIQHYENSPNLTIPSNIYAVVDTELNLWYDGIVCGNDRGLASPLNYDIEIICEVGAQWERCYRIKPIVGNVGSYPLLINVYDVTKNLVETKTVTLNVVANTAPTAVKNIVHAGDSLTSYGTMTSRIYDKFAELGSNIPLFWGKKGTGLIKHEGYGGWTFNSFASAGTPWYKFFISGVTAVGIGDRYTHNGSLYQIMEVNITSGSGYVSGQMLSGGIDPLTSGGLTKSLGSGDATINFSTYEVVSANPFWSGGALNIANYRASLGMVGLIDIFMIQLGINDVGIGNALITDATITTIINQSKSIVDAFLADNPNTKIIIALPSTDGNTKGGYGSNYGATGSKVHFQKNIYKLRKALLATYDSSAYNANVFIGIAGLTIDRYWSYGLDDRNISDVYAVAEKVHNNAVHPGTYGYYQMADAYYAQLQNLI